MLIPLQHADDNIQPFANAALELHRYGLAPFQCGGDDGKRPLVKGFTSRRFSQNTHREFIGKFGDCNVGIATGKLSNITVVDVDDPEIVEQMLHKFGDTLLTDIPHMPSKFVEFVPLSHRQGKCIPYAAIRWHDFGNRPALGRPLGHFSRHPDTPLLSLSPRRRFPRPTPERVFVADHQSSSGFSGTGPSAPPPQPIGT